MPKPFWKEGNAFIFTTKNCMLKCTYMYFKNIQPAVVGICVGIFVKHTFCYLYWNQKNYLNQNKGKITLKIFLWGRMSLAMSWRHSGLLYPATLKSAGYYVIPSIQKIEFECPSACLSVCLYVHPSVSASFSLSAGSIFNHFFFKLAMRVDIGKECPWIADGYYRVTALDWRKKLVFTIYLWHSFTDFHQTWYESWYLEGVSWDCRWVNLGK